MKKNYDCVKLAFAENKLASNDRLNVAGCCRKSLTPACSFVGNTAQRLIALCALTLALSCVYPTFDGDPEIIDEQQSVWQHLSVFSIFQERVPTAAESFNLTPNQMFDRIADTLRGNRYTAYTTASFSRGAENASVSAVEAVGNICAVRGKVTACWLTDSTTAYMYISDFSNESIALFRAYLNALSEYPNIIIDVMKNGGGLLSVADEIVSEFLPANTGFIETELRIFNDNARKGETVNRTRRTYTTQERQRYNLNPEPMMLGKKVVVLMDGGSASASEILAAALKDRGGAVLLGEQSYGKGIAQLQIVRPGRNDLSVTFMNIRGLDSGSIREYHRDGIPPDEIPQELIDEAETLLPYDEELLADINWQRVSREDLEEIYPKIIEKYGVSPGMYLYFHFEPDVYFALRILEPERSLIFEPQDDEPDDESQLARRRLASDGVNLIGGALTLQRRQSPIGLYEISNFELPDMNSEK